MDESTRSILQALVDAVEEVEPGTGEDYVAMLPDEALVEIAKSFGYEDEASLRLAVRKMIAAVEQIRLANDGAIRRLH